MRCASVVCLVATLFVVVYSGPELCAISELLGRAEVISRINLRGQPLKQLPYNAFWNVSSQSRLTGILLRQCDISHVDAGALLNLHSLTAIDLSRNDINHIEKRVEFMDTSFKDKFDNLTHLRLYDNPWRCDCELRPLYELLIKIDQLQQRWLLCENPPTLHGIIWREISRNEFVCPADEATSTLDSVITSTVPMTTTELDDNIPVAVYDETRNGQVDTGIAQTPSNQNWTPYTILVVGLVCVAIAVIVGVVLLKRRSFRRANVCNMDSDLSMRIIESRAASEYGESASNMADVDEEQTSIHHYEIREVTIS